jgi:hypothetical protein
VVGVVGGAEHAATLYEDTRSVTVAPFIGLFQDLERVIVAAHHNERRIVLPFDMDRAPGT